MNVMATNEKSKRYLYYKKNQVNDKNEELNINDKKSSLSVAPVRRKNVGGSTPHTKKPSKEGFLSSINILLFYEQFE